MASSIISNVRVVILGDAGTGKSSLIIAVATDSFPATVTPVLPTTCLSPDSYQGQGPINIIDTSSRPEDRGKLEAECKKADAIVLTYACDRPETLDRLSSFWLPKLRLMDVRVPVIIVGCKLDLCRDHHQSLEQKMTPILEEYKEIETCIECSALKQIQVAEVFQYAEKAVLHPTAPLFDQEAQTLKPRCVRALMRIFILCDHDGDDALSDAELNDFQVKCFNTPLEPSELLGVKKVVSEKFPEGVNESGITLTGFLFLHALFIEHGKLENMWTVLHKFGYDYDVKLQDDMLQTPSFERAPDQSVELTDKATDFLKWVFYMYDLDGDGALRPQEVEDLFSTAPSSPWDDPIYNECAERNAMGCLTLNGFLSQWDLMTLLDPVKSLAHLIYLNYPGDVCSAFQIMRRRYEDRKRQCTQRNVLTCYVFGPTRVGKSALLRALTVRPYVDHYTHTGGDQYSAHVVEPIGGTTKTLILREISTASIEMLLAKKDALAACDVAAFVFDSSDESSWKQTSDLLLEVTAHGEKSGFEVPSLLIATKDDLGAPGDIVSDSAKVCQDLGMEAPISLSVKLGDLNHIYRRIVGAAQCPHLSIPVTKTERNYRQYKQIVNRSLVAISVGAAVAVVGLAAYRVYCARRQASS